jgi:hypothetical protein
MSVLVIVTEENYLRYDGVFEEFDEHNWTKKEIDKSKYYYVHDLNDEEKIYLFCNDMFESTARSIASLLPKDNIQKLLILTHNEDDNWREMNIEFEFKNTFHHKESDSIFNEGIEPFVNEPDQDNFDEVLSLIKNKNSIDKSKTTRESSKYNAQRLSDIRHDITTLFITLQFDLQTILMKNNNEQRIKVAEEIIEEYLSNSVFPCSILLSEALFYVTGQAYIINGYDPGLSSNKITEATSLYDYAESGNISKNKYNSVVSLCPLKKGGGDAPFKVTSDACIIKFLNSLDSSIESKSPTQLVQVSIGGTSSCAKIAYDDLNKNKKVNTYDASDFCIWFDEFAKKVHEVSLK